MLNSLDGKEWIRIPKAYVITALPFDNAPELHVGLLDRWDYLKGIHLLYVLNKEITMLIGSDIPAAHCVIDQRIGRRREPFAPASILGWVLRGPFRGNVDMNFQVNCMTTTYSIESMLNRMYNHQSEELRCTDFVSQDGIKAIRLVNSSIKNANGHYTIGLPWKVNPEILPDNKSLALGRLRYLKNRLIRILPYFWVIARSWVVLFHPPMLLNSLTENEI